VIVTVQNPLPSSRSRVWAPPKKRNWEHLLRLRKNRKEKRKENFRQPLMGRGKGGEELNQESSKHGHSQHVCWPEETNVKRTAPLGGEGHDGNPIIKLGLKKPNGTTENRGWRPENSTRLPNQREENGREEKTKGCELQTLHQYFQLK